MSSTLYHERGVGVKQEVENELFGLGASGNLDAAKLSGRGSADIFRMEIKQFKANIRNNTVYLR